MSYRYRRSIRSLARAHKSDEELIAKADASALIERRSLGLNGYANDRFSNSVRMLIRTGSELVDISQRLKGNVLVSGPLFFEVHRSGGAQAENIDNSALWSKGVINMHYEGDRRDLRNIRKNLASMAQKLSRHRDRLPDIMAGVSHRDIIRPASRLLGAKAVRVPIDHVDATVWHSAFIKGNDSRKAYGKPPLTDLNLYQLTVPTDYFIERFGSR